MTEGYYSVIENQVRKDYRIQLQINNIHQYQTITTKCKFILEAVNSENRAFG